MKGTTYGYCRISRKTQSIDRQIRNIKQAYPDAVIVAEAYTGRKLDRPEWTKLHKRLCDGDTVVFDSVSRMSRNSEDGYQLYEELYGRGVNLVFLKEPHINTDTYRQAIQSSVQMTGTNADILLEAVNKYLMVLAKDQIRLAFIQSEKEVEDLRQRTREGIQTARLNGKQIGNQYGSKLTTKKSIVAKKVMRKHAKEFGGSLNDVEMMELTGLSRNTYYKYKRELKSEVEI